MTAQTSCVHAAGPFRLFTSRKTLLASPCYLTRIAVSIQQRHRGSRHRICRIVAAAEPPAIIPKPKLVSDEWQAVLNLQSTNSVVKGKITAVAKGGVIVDFDVMTGFMPYSLMDPTRIPATLEDKQNLIGQPVKAKIVEVNVPERRVVLSTRAASLAKLVRKLKIGDVVEGVVSYVSDFGAFVMLKDPEGELNGAEGLVHISELSWEWVPTPDKVVQPGQIVRVKVIAVDKNLPRINLSLRQLQDDPLMETLDDVLPLDSYDTILQVPRIVPETVAEVCEALARVEGVTGVALGRQAEEKRTVSQDLELWITKELVADGYNLVARAGRIVQEIHVSTDLSRELMKQTIQDLLKRIV